MEAMQVAHGKIGRGATAEIQERRRAALHRRLFRITGNFAGDCVDVYRDLVLDVIGVHLERAGMTFRAAERDVQVQPEVSIFSRLLLKNSMDRTDLTWRPSGERRVCGDKTISNVRWAD